MDSELRSKHFQLYSIFMKNKTQFALSAVSLALTLVATSALAADPEVTPYRPGVGSPAVVNAPGTIEVEVGYDYAKASGARVDNLGTLLKYGVNSNIGLTLGVSPYVKLSGGGASVSGPSDINLGVKYVTKVQPELAAGAQLTVSVPTGSKNVGGGGKSNVALTGLIGVDFAGFHSDINLGLTRAGENPGAGVSRNRIGWSASLGRTISGPLSAAVELSGNRLSGADSTVQLLGSLSYSVNSSLVVDGYLARARTTVSGSNVNSNGFGVGFSYLVAK